MAFIKELYVLFRSLLMCTCTCNIIFLSKNLGSVCCLLISMNLLYIEMVKMLVFA